MIAQLRRFGVFMAALTLPVMVLVTACGGGNGGGREAIAPSGTLVFPTRDMSVPGPTVTVKGMGSEGADAILVNGIAGSSNDNFATWSAQIPIVPGSNSITVEFESAGQRSTIATSSIFRGIEPFGISSVSSPDGNEIVFVDLHQSYCFKWNMLTRDRVAVSIPYAPQSQNVTGVTFDAQRNQALIYTAVKLILVHFDTAVADDIPLPTILLNSPSVTFDPAANIYYLTTGSHANPGQIWKFSPQDSTFQLHATASAGPPPNNDLYLSGLCWDAANGRLLAYGMQTQTVFSVDAAGVIMPFSVRLSSTIDTSIPSSPAFILDTATNAIYLHDSSYITRIDLTTQARVRTGPAFMPYGFRAGASTLPDGRIIAWRGDRLIAYDFLADNDIQLMALGLGELGDLDVFQAITSIAFDCQRRRLLIGTAGYVVEGVIDLDLVTLGIDIVADGLTSIVRGITNLHYDAEMDRIFCSQSTSPNPYALANFAEAPAAGATLSTSTNPAVAVASVLEFDSVARMYVVGTGYFSASNRATDIALHLDDGSLVGFWTLPGIRQITGCFDSATGLYYTVAESDLGSGELVASFDHQTDTTQTISGLGEPINLTSATDMMIHPVTGEALVCKLHSLVGVNLLTGERRLIADFNARLPLVHAKGITVDPLTGIIYVVAQVFFGGIPDSANAVRTVIAVEESSGDWGVLSR